MLVGQRDDRVDLLPDSPELRDELELSSELFSDSLLDPAVERLRHGRGVEVAVQVRGLALHGDHAVLALL